MASTPDPAADSNGTDRFQGSGGVVLLHGMGRTGFSLRSIAAALRRGGTPTLSPSYGLRRSMAEIIAFLHPRITAFAAANPGPLHFVTHSLGGLVARAYITAHRPPALGRVVMLAPPNAGSELADFVFDLGLDTLIFGPVGPHLRTLRPDDHQAQLGAVDFDLGIIAGDRPFDPIIAPRLLPGANDGKVSVAATRIDGMRDHIVLPVQHTFMVHDAAVIDQVRAYLATGAFAR
ncbi:alpha/beta fold hydrolase [Polymorphobacter fuscus]|uniref:Alpha/beta fold hydrolase n=1 Tax=Sandarakinorhabdus fusca TaxID=1439888 RepID=A0A7C9GWV5_9SPHN|nr:alpha/beta fold hydrolase [Polymorphobacter fuscus]KAB7644113.1 alpha/beta fold hydrolase [Polymorphobacter fuscus]MQT18498.1 alpha/beta fold hydrolase [Polymorphobacter fuscus]NJC08381.1 pimeloyl-ACP methyl ester carboxylesterase [Polymorphobacter fuscus]